VFEAAFWRVPSIVAVSNPQPDTMIDGQTGLCIEPGNPAALADGIARFCLTPGEVARMGNAAYELALRNFDGRRNAALVLDIYHRVLRSAGSAAVKR
jgi:glycosyltransferase involved in cell wall biosynthesis